MNRAVAYTTIAMIAVALIIPSILYAFEGKVVSISDGDTIKVLKDGKQVKIRLAAIDCPEKGQPYWRKAKKLTASLVAGKIVKVWETDIDRYGRIVGFVFIGDKNLNKELLAAGLAWHYKKYSRDPELLNWSLMRDQLKGVFGLSQILCHPGSGGDGNNLTVI